MKKANKQFRHLDRAEWDFSAVTDVELEACFAHELAREVADPVSYFQLKRPFWEIHDEAMGKHGDAPLTHSQQELLVMRRWLPFIDDHNFRGLPWLFIPADKRLLSAKERTYGTGFHCVPERFFSNETSRPNFYEITDEGTQLLPVVINWNESNASILAGLRFWLENYRPAQAQAVVKIGRQSIRDDLRHLSALRLRHAYSVEEAVALTKKELGSPLYAQRQAWDMAHKQGIKLFSMYFRGAGNPKSATKKSNRRSSGTA